MAYLLAEAGWEFIGAASRSFESARRACRFVGDGIPADDDRELVHAADLTLITTPDDVIEGICNGLADKGAIRPETVIAHCSGALDSTILSAAGEQGAYVGSLHPLQTFASVEQAVDLTAGSSCCIEGDATAVTLLEKVAADLKMHPFAIPTQNKPLYHAAAVMSCNYLVALEAAAMHTAAAAGIDEEEALGAFLPLIEGTVHNLGSEGLPGALTGPIARGDAATLRRHLEAMERTVPDLLPLYRAMADQTIDLARRGDFITEEKAGELRQIIK